MRSTSGRGRLAVDWDSGREKGEADRGEAYARMELKGQQGRYGVREKRERGEREGEREREGDSDCEGNRERMKEEEE